MYSCEREEVKVGACVHIFSFANIIICNRIVIRCNEKLVVWSTLWFKKLLFCFKHNNNRHTHTLARACMHRERERMEALIPSAWNIDVCDAIGRQSKEVSWWQKGERLSVQTEVWLRARPWPWGTAPSLTPFCANEDLLGDLSSYYSLIYLFLRPFICHFAWANLSSSPCWYHCHHEQH